VRTAPSDRDTHSDSKSGIRAFGAIAFIPFLDVSEMNYTVAFLAVPEAMFTSVLWSDIIEANYAFVTAYIRVFLQGKN
jgi:hypothetical protein